MEQTDGVRPAAENGTAALPPEEPSAADAGVQGAEGPQKTDPWTLPNRAIRKESWKRLSGSYGKLLGAQAIIAVFVLCVALLGGILTIATDAYAYSGSAAGTGVGKAILSAVLSLLVTVLGYGFSMQCLNVFLCRPIRANEVFAAFSGGRFGRMLLFVLLMSAIGYLPQLSNLVVLFSPNSQTTGMALLTLWLWIGLTVPVFILQLCLAPTPYLLLTGTCKTLPQALKESFRRMRGKKGSLFCHIVATYWWLALIVAACYGLFLAVGLGAVSTLSLSGMLLSLLPLPIALAAVFFLNPRCALCVAGWMAQRIPEYRPAPPETDGEAGAPEAPGDAFTPEEQAAADAVPDADAIPWDPSLGAPPEE